MKEKYLCLHGHFYQPPRENPWLGIIELQPSARPFHDWNERITRECYAPNARARVLNDRGLINSLKNNYELMSFNFGPTLLSWLQTASPWTYEQILAADKSSAVRLNGHGNALAQVYNHIIMPLAGKRDKLTQIRWGKADFMHRFGRKPEGMWLAETAVDTESLRMMAREGIKFTLLSPEQAKEFRPIKDKNPPPWEDVTGGRIDPRQPYRLFFDDSRHEFIDIFFYDGPTSRAVAYERLLTSGPALLGRIESAFGVENGRSLLVNLATDGESYGHHSKFGEMALAWLFDHIQRTENLKIINYAAYLDLFPPEFEVRIIENSSWSCAHGVERWRSDCGCHVGGQPGWNQAWRKPFREGLDWVAGELASLFEAHGGDLLKDPWAARDDYISVLLNPVQEARDAFLDRHAARPLNGKEKSEVLRLMESQLMSMFMFTSCGWFFDDISGLEPVQNMKYAARAMELAEPWTSNNLRSGLLEHLAEAKSNVPEYRNGAEIFRSVVEPARLDPSKVAAHFALARVGLENGETECPVSKRAKAVSQRRLTASGLVALFGEVEITDERTADSARRSFLAVHDGGAGLACLVDREPGLDVEAVSREIRSALEDASLDLVERTFHRRRPQAVRFTLDDLISDTRNYLVRSLLLALHSQVMDWVRQFYDSNQDVVSLLRRTGVQVPQIQGCLFRLIAGDQLIRRLTPGENGSPARWNELLAVTDQIKEWGLSLNEPAVRLSAKEFFLSQIGHIITRPTAEDLGYAAEFLADMQDLELGLDLWEAQNTFFNVFQDQPFTDSMEPAVAEAWRKLALVMGFAVKED